MNHHIHKYIQLSYFFIISDDLKDFAPTLKIQQAKAKIRLSRSGKRGGGGKKNAPFFLHSFTELLHFYLGALNRITSHTFFNYQTVIQEDSCCKRFYLKQ